MSEFEKINQKIAAQKAARRKETIKELVRLLAKVLWVVLVFVVLAHIGFISELFMVLLVSATVCTGAFNAGRIWSCYKR